MHRMVKSVVYEASFDIVLIRTFYFLFTINRKKKQQYSVIIYTNIAISCLHTQTLSLTHTSRHAQSRHLKIHEEK